MRMDTGHKLKMRQYRRYKWTQLFNDSNHKTTVWHLWLPRGCGSYAMLASSLQCLPKMTTCRFEPGPARQPLKWQALSLGIYFENLGIILAGLMDMDLFQQPFQQWEPSSAAGLKNWALGWVMDLRFEYYNTSPYAWYISTSIQTTICCYHSTGSCSLPPSLPLDSPRVGKLQIAFYWALVWDSRRFWRCTVPQSWDLQ